MKRLLAFILIITVMASLSTAFADTPGGQDDPLISLRFLPDYISNVLNKAENIIAESLGKLKDTMTRRLAQIEINSPSGDDFARNYRTIYLDRGGTVTVKTGGSVYLLSGTARITDLSGTVINVTDGTVVGKGQRLSANNRYFAAERTAAMITVFSDNAILSVSGGYSTAKSGEIPAAANFNDIDSHWAMDYILYLALNGYVNGMGEQIFEPNYKMSRAMFVTVLGRIYGINTESHTSTPFTDVRINEWYGPYVSWAAQNGIVNGFGDGTFLPNQEITREQMSLVIMRFADFQGLSLPETASNTAFSDDWQISSWARSAVYRSQRTGLLKGRDTGEFDPKGTATRAEVCTMLYRFINASINT